MPILLAVLLAGCAGASGAVELVGDDPRIVVQQRGGEGMDALIEARLHYDPGHGPVLDGDPVVAGGGYQGRDAIDGLSDLGLPEPCLPERVFLFSGEFPDDDR